MLSFVFLLLVSSIFPSFLVFLVIISGLLKRGFFPFLNVLVVRSNHDIDFVGHLLDSVIGVHIGCHIGVNLTHW